MTANLHSRHMEQVMLPVDAGVAEYPILPTHAEEVSVLDPLHPLVRMAASRPSPEALPYFVVYTGERALAGTVAVIVRPAQQDRVQAINQLVPVSALAPTTFDDPANPIQQTFDALLRRLGQQFVTIPPDVQSEEVKAFFDVV